MIHHVFLPPQLPQKDDTNLEYETYMSRTLCDSVAGFAGFLKAESSSCSSLHRAQDMLQRFLKTGDGSVGEGMDRAKVLSDMIAKLKSGGAYSPCHTIPPSQSISTQFIFHFSQAPVSH